MQKEPSCAGPRYEQVCRHSWTIGLPRRCVSRQATGREKFPLANLQAVAATGQDRGELDICPGVKQGQSLDFRGAVQERKQRLRNLMPGKLWTRTQHALVGHVFPWHAVQRALHAVDLKRRQK
eukprot:scaffold66316_cov26-Tisochrysis_lutea.AAC.1